ncbi:MAG: dockerin type I domain-containing protein [Candidatus Diapherotrites archaeon]
MNFVKGFLLTTISFIIIISLVMAVNNNYIFNEKSLIEKLQDNTDENKNFNNPLTSIDPCTNPPNCSFTVEGDVLSDMNFYARWFGNEYRVYLNWTPNFCQARQYNFRIHLWDGPNYSGFSDHTLTVNNVNRLPTISVAPTYQEVLKGSTATVSITAQDLDYSECHDDDIALSVNPNTLGNLTDNGNGTGTFTWTPGLDANTVLPYDFTFKATDNYTGFDEDTAQIQVRSVCGDAKLDDGKVTVSDVIYLVNYLFKGGPAPADMDAADVNNDGKVNVTDVIYLVNYLFKGGTAPNCGY